MASDRRSLVTVVGVRLGRYGPVRFYGAEGMTLVPGEQVVAVDDAGAEGLGSVVIAPEQLLDSEATPHACGSVRPASAADVERLGPREETAGGRLLRRLEP